MNRSTELRRMLADHQPFHSEFQMDRFITAQHGGTRWGCYRQALREIRTRFDALKLDYIGIERLKLRIVELLQQSTCNDIEEKRTALDLAEAQMSLDTIEVQAKDRCREFIRFFDQARALQRSLGELTPARRAQLERELWEYRVKSAAAMDWFSGGLTTSTLEAMRSLHVEMRARVWEAIKPENKDALTNWWLNYEFELPELLEAATTPAEVEDLLCRSQLLPTSSG